jgi:hypothetical protein
MFYLDLANQVLWLEKVLFAIEAEVVADTLAKKSYAEEIRTTP